MFGNNSKIMQSKDFGVISFDHLDKVPEGRFQILIDDTEYSCYFQSGCALLYLFTTCAHNQDKRYPIFQRHSYSKYTNAAILCIDDPSYLYNKKITNGWYIGTENNDYSLDIAKIVIRVSELLSILSNNIIIFGSSSGGTAALRIASNINNANAVAINPQILPLINKWTNCYSTQSGMRFEDFPERCNTIDHISRTNKSIIIFNDADETDYLQVDYLLSNFGIYRRSIGLTQLTDNSLLWIYHADGVPGGEIAHGCQETPYIFKIIEECVKK